MCPEMLFEIVDVVLKDLKNSREDFKGIVTLKAGNHVQFPPLVSKTSTFVYRGHIWTLPVRLLR